MDDYHAERAALHVAVNGPMESRGSSSREITDDAIAFVDAHRDQKFFLWVHYYDPHLSYETHPEVPSFGPSRVDRYDGEIRFTDLHLGRLIAHLRAAGLWDRTAVVLTGDHGEGFGEHGVTEHGFDLYPPQTKVPFIVRVPGLAPRRVRVPVGHIDIAPTLVNLGARRRRAGVHRPLAGPGRRRSARARHRHARRVPGGDVGAREEARAGDDDAAPDLERGARRHDRVLRPHARSGRGARHLAGGGTTTARARRWRARSSATGRRAGAAARAPPTKLARRRSRRRAAPRRRPRTRWHGALGDADRWCAATTVVADASSRRRDARRHVSLRASASRSPPGWRLFFHLEGPGGYRNLDHVPVDGLMPIERWRPGQALRDRQRIPIPPGTPRGTYTLYLGAFRGAERLPVTPAALNDGNNRLRLLSFVVSPSNADPGGPPPRGLARASARPHAMIGWLPLWKRPRRG